MNKEPVPKSPITQILRSTPCLMGKTENPMKKTLFTKQRAVRNSGSFL